VEDIAFLFAAGDRVLFATEQDRWAHLYSMPAGGGKETLLTADQSVESRYRDRHHVWRFSVEGRSPARRLPHRDHAGRAFRETPNTGWRGRSEYEDVVAGAKYLQSVPYVNVKKIEP
jgi:hypothetical protein